MRCKGPYLASGWTYVTTGVGLGAAAGGGAIATGAGDITPGRIVGGAGDVGVRRMCARDISVGVGGFGAACAGL